MRLKLLIHFFVILGSFATSSIAFAQKKVIRVSTAQEFVNALGSNRTIELAEDFFYISDVPPSVQSEFFRYQHNSIDGYELILSNISNCTIKGIGARRTRITAKPSYGNVFVFENCENITLENLHAGHGPERGYCIGGVFSFKNSKNIKISNCWLFGSGIEGITTENVVDLTCEKTVITGCSYGILSLSNTKNATFFGCEFIDNREFDLINIYGGEAILFKNCIFSNNYTRMESEYDDYALIFPNDIKSLSFNGCVFENNACAYFGKNRDLYTFTDCRWMNNHFDKGMYKSKD